MSRDAVLNYSTPPRLLSPRANWLAVFSFAWTFGAAPLSICLYAAGSAALARAAPGWASVTLELLALVAVPAVGSVAAFVATERGAGWDSPYRWTALAVWASPFANMTVGGGVVFCARALRGVM